MRCGLQGRSPGGGAGGGICRGLGGSDRHGGRRERVRRHIAHEHGDGDRANGVHDKAGRVGAVVRGRDVRHNVVVPESGPDVDDHRPWPDAADADHPRLAGRRDQHVGLAAEAAQVLAAAADERDGGAPGGEHLGKGLPGEPRAPDHHDPPALDLHAIVAEDAQHTLARHRRVRARRRGQRGVRAAREMRAVDVPHRRDGVVGPAGVDLRGQRPHELEAVGVRVPLQHSQKILGCRALGQLHLLDVHAEALAGLRLGEPTSVLRGDQLQPPRPIRVRAAERGGPDGDHRQPRRPPVLGRGLLGEPSRLEVHLPGDGVRIHDPVARRPDRRVQGPLDRPRAREPGRGPPPGVGIDDAELPAAPGALDVAAAQPRAALDELPAVQPMLALALHAQDCVGGLRRVLHDLAPALERCAEEGPQRLAVAPVAQRFPGCEEHLGITQRDLREGAALERDDLRGPAEVVGQAQGLHHVVGLHGVDLARQQAPQLLAARKDADVGLGQNPAHQVPGVRMHPDAEPLPGGGPAAQLRARRPGDAQRGPPEHRGHGLDAAAGLYGRQQGVLLHGAHEKRPPALPPVPLADDARLLTRGALRQQSQVDARPRVEAAAHGYCDANKLRGHVVVKLKVHAAHRA
mmetsp:Transcript_113073/g.352448  ORF Transcript_113073/g.352448 Transcript_113073/m.352448 type:complete len:631 (+) Transcript_113073:425-2317(+)